MSSPVLSALEAPVLRDSAPDPAVLAFFKAVTPTIVRRGLKFRDIAFLRGERAVGCFRDFQEGRSRLLVAFRHPYGDEPQLLGDAISRVVPRLARKAGTPLPRLNHVHFIHGYEVPYWAPPIVRWILPRVGAVPVHHVKLDSKGVDRLRTLMREGPFPVALAPEGQVSYVSRDVPRLEQGFARLGVWCAEDMEKAGRPEEVTVLPLSVHHDHGREAPRFLERILLMLEDDCGIPRKPGASPRDRLLAAAEALVAEAEAFYAGLDGKAFERAEAGAGLDDRFAAVIEAALRAGERAMRLPAEGDVVRRVYAIRQAGWDRIFREDLRPGNPPPSPVRRALMDRAAAEAWYAMRHMELADIGFYLKFDVTAADEGDAEALIETAVNYRDLASRLRGGNITDRSDPFPRKAVIVAGEPMRVRPLLPAYRADRRATLEAMTKDLESRFRDCIRDFLESRTPSR